MFFSKRRTAMTLVELLVVISIVAVLVMLLLPALVRVREAARRTECTNNIKQMALAAQNYHDAFETFPYGAAGGWGHTWHAYLLPYLEQIAIYSQIPWTDNGWGNDLRPADPFTRVARVAIPIFRCPSQPGPRTKKWNGISGRAVTNYVGNAGGDMDTNNGTLPGSSRTDARFSNGVLLASNFVNPFGRTAPKAIRDVRDGTSSTILLGESRFAMDQWCRCCDRAALYSPGIDADRKGPDAGSDYSEALCSTFFGINGTSPKSSSVTTRRQMSFGSYHPDGCNAACVDGAVHFFNETIDLQVWRALGSRAKGEIIESDVLIH